MKTEGNSWPGSVKNIFFLFDKINMSSQREDGLFLYIYVNTLICDWLVTFLYMF